MFIPLDCVGSVSSHQLRKKGFSGQVSVWNIFHRKGVWGQPTSLAPNVAYLWSAELGYISNLKVLEKLFIFSYYVTYN